MLLLTCYSHSVSSYFSFEDQNTRTSYVLPTTQDFSNVFMKHFYFYEFIKTTTKTTNQSTKQTKKWLWVHPLSLTILVGLGKLFSNYPFSHVLMERYYHNVLVPFLTPLLRIYIWKTVRNWSTAFWVKNRILFQSTSRNFSGIRYLIDRRLSNQT